MHGQLNSLEDSGLIQIPEMDEAAVTFFYVTTHLIQRQNIRHQLRLLIF